ncbi:MAG TPA: SMP-30/gluconolactonase/LRE family protein [Aliidongia sp.]|uniref:SMP-30/gluconolactonase/LRE family protein n=1 Tax=Aliidongia sp. TaxID=1914230 RepID=UPI002DDD5A18|nr:SMP-30/gluconolactonase/LRE family protein [Aliidongia sp.]HEV2673351.1 SMP-30/gluconolactonase/LRE family protein [Aliidongia sp.]
MEIEVVVPGGATIGEAPTWVAAEAALYWIDIKRPALYRLDPATGAQRSWPMPSDIGAFALTADPPGAVVALRTGLFRLDFASDKLDRLAPPPFDPKLFRFNEGACDINGRFWIGVMFDPLTEASPPLKSSMHSFTLAGGLRPEPDAAELHNGMAWSADNEIFYLSHSQRQAIFAYEFDPAAGRLGAPRLFASVPKDDGLPDGAAIDDLGGYWCALHGGGRLRRYKPSGAVDCDIALPVSQPTMCAFGGADLEDLYVTSASDQLMPEQRRREPLAGALLKLRPGVSGLARSYLVR